MATILVQHLMNYINPYPITPNVYITSLNSHFPKIYSGTVYCGLSRDCWHERKPPLTNRMADRVQAPCTPAGSKQNIRFGIT